MTTTAPHRGPRRLLTQRQQERDLITAAFVGVAQPGKTLQILEAGCGQKWSVKLPGVDLHLTGVDDDPEALRLRLEVQQDLDHAVVGDLRTVELAAGAYDVAYCAFVLEHVDGADRVLDQLVSAVRPGGRIVLLIPDGQSVVGWAAKTFPLQVAVLYEKYIEGFKDAGKPGHAPYPTVYDPVVSLAGMRAYADSRDLRIVEEYGID